MVFIDFKIQYCTNVNLSYEKLIYEKSATAKHYENSSLCSINLV